MTSEHHQQTAIIFFNECLFSKPGTVEFSQIKQVVMGCMNTLLQQCNPDQPLLSYDDDEYDEFVDNSGAPVIYILDQDKAALLITAYNQAMDRISSESSAWGALVMAEQLAELTGTRLTAEYLNT